MTAAVREFIRQVRTIPTGTPRRVVVATPQAPKSTFMADLYREILDPDTPWLSVPPADLADVSAAAKAIGAEMIVHMHWTSWALGTLDRKPAEEALRRALDILDGVQDHRMIWTVHNTLPHECRHEDLEVVLRQRLADQADVIHIMNPNTREVVAPWYDLPEAKTVQADHPWPHVQRIDRNEACRMLGLDPRYRWIGFLGQIRAYKDLESLLGSIENPQQPARLLVAGEPDRTLSTRSTVAQARRHPLARALLGFLSDVHLTAAISACDTIALPYARPLNSGIAAIADAVGVPAIQPGDDTLRPAHTPTQSTSPAGRSDRSDHAGRNQDPLTTVVRRLFFPLG